MLRGRLVHAGENYNGFENFGRFSDHWGSYSTSPDPLMEKERKRIYIAPFIYYVYLKALRHGSHSFTCKYTMLAFPSYAFTRWRHL